MSSTPARTRPLVRLADVDKTYANATVALRRLSLDVAPGEFVSLLGPSGCGKSTALRLVAGLGRPTGGRIDWPIASHDAAGEPDRQIGFVFQEPNLMPWATVFDNAYLPLRLQGISRRAAAPRVEEVLAMVGLAGFQDAYPRELSGGMKMRVSIARAFVTSPSLLLMDEPFAALDEITRNRLSADLLRMWRSTDCTVMFVTHSVFESVFMSSRIVVMAARPGRIIGELNIDAAYPRGPEFRLTADFMGHCRAVSALLDTAIQA